MIGNGQVKSLACVLVLLVGRAAASNHEQVVSRILEAAGNSAGRGYSLEHVKSRCESVKKSATSTEFRDAVTALATSGGGSRVLPQPGRCYVGCMAADSAFLSENATIPWCPVFLCSPFLTARGNTHIEETFRMLISSQGGQVLPQCIIRGQYHRAA